MCKLWDDPNTKALMERLEIPEPNFSLCDDCGGKVHIGDWGICKGKFGSHDAPEKYRPFVGFWDPHIAPHAPGIPGTWIGSLREWDSILKREGKYVADDESRRHEAPEYRGDTKGMDAVFNRAVREFHGDMVVKDEYGRKRTIGSLLRDDD